MNKSSSLEEQILNQWPSQLDGHLHYCIGLSGGIDSVVLLHILANLKYKRNLTLSAIHVNHGISSNSGSWEEFCRNLCREHDIPLATAKLKITKEPGQGLENTARKLRYKEFAKMAPSVIITAHHQDDQIETMLSQIMRGSDLHNIAGMQPVSSRQGQLYWRPLLSHAKKQLLDYAQMHQITNIEDESNLNNHYLRNFLRNEIIPKLKEYDSDIITKLARSLDSIQKNVQLTDEITICDLNNCMNNNKIDLSQFKLLSSLRQLNILARFIKIANLPLPSQKQLTEFNHQILNAAPDRHPSLKLSDQFKISRQSQALMISKI